MTTRGNVSGGGGAGRSFAAAPAVEWCLVRLRKGDTLASLATEYGTTPRAIAAGNGVAWSTAAINAWVLSTGGVRLPYSPSHPNPAEPSKGWPVFSDASVIRLPRGRRPCVSSQPSTTAKAAGGLGLLALLLLGALALKG